MKKVYIVVVVCLVYICSLFALLYLNYRFVENSLTNYNRFEISLHDNSNNDSNNMLSQELYNDFKDNELEVIYIYDSVENENQVTNIITNNPDQLPDELQSKSFVNIEDFSELTKVKGRQFTVYVKGDYDAKQSKYDYSTSKEYNENILINDWYGYFGLMLFTLALLTLIITTLLYEERESERLQTLVFDGNSVTYIYFHLFSKAHFLIMLISLIMISVSMFSLDLFSWRILVYFITFNAIAYITSIVTLTIVYCNYKPNRTPLRVIKIMFQVIHIIVIVLLVGSIGNTVNLYTKIKPNQDYLKISSKLEGYESFPQSMTGSATLDYDIKAPLYTDYYNFLNENYDTILSLLITLPEISSNDINVNNNIVLVNHSYFDVFDIYKPDNSIIKANDFDDDKIYQLTSDGATFEWNLLISSDQVTIENISILENQDAWFIDGSMSLYAAHPLVGGTLLVIPDKINAAFINEYSVYNWINAIMSSQTLLVKEASDSPLNKQYLQEHGLDTTFRNWTEVSAEYDSLMTGIYKKMALYRKLIIIETILVVILCMVDVYIYLQLNRRKIALQIVDGNNGTFILRSYVVMSIVKLLIIGYAAYAFLHLTPTTIMISELLITGGLLVFLILVVKYISLNNIKFINKER